MNTRHTQKASSETTYNESMDKSLHALNTSRGFKSYSALDLFNENTVPFIPPYIPASMNRPNTFSINLDSAESISLAQIIFKDPRIDEEDSILNKDYESSLSFASCLSSKVPVQTTNQLYIPSFNVKNTHKFKFKFKFKYYE